MTTTTTISELAGRAYDAFTTATRRDETIVVLRDDAPDWVRALAADAHGAFFPDDWRYQSIRSALGFIHDQGVETADELDDAGHEWADGNVDIYNGARTAWLASNLMRAEYCDEAVEEFGQPEHGILGLIGLGQYVESGEIWASVLKSLADELEAGD